MWNSYSNYSNIHDAYKVNHMFSDTAKFNPFEYRDIWQVWKHILKATIYP